MIVIFYLSCEIAFIAFTLLVGSQKSNCHGKAGSLWETNSTWSNSGIEHWWNRNWK